MLVLAVIGQVRIASMAYAGTMEIRRNKAPSLPSRLADVTGIPRETVRRKLTLLANKGWIERTPEGPGGLWCARRRLRPGRLVGTRPESNPTDSPPLRRSRGTRPFGGAPRQAPLADALNFCFGPNTALGLCRLCAAMRTRTSSAEAEIRDVCDALRVTGHFWCSRGD